MKNADGSYRVMPGFASLFGGGARGRHHPPVDAAKIDARAEPAVVPESLAEANVGDAAGGTGGGGCPVKPADRSSLSSLRSWSILSRGGSGPGSDAMPTTNDGDDTGAQRPNDSDNADGDGNERRQRRPQYDVYSRPLPMDPTNNMPVVNPSTVARNSLPSPGQSVALPTERVSSSIPKVAGVVGAEGQKAQTWTYPSPQMFYNALARKGKLDPETREEDMVSVVAIHNCMNEGTWERILQWERVLHPPPKDSGDKNVGGPSLTKFMGRPTDLSPKAALKHYLFGHPLPFDRHDWTVTRTDPTDGSTSDVRYVIDYYHDDSAAREEEGSGTPGLHDGIGEGGKVRSLLVDVRPAADSLSEVWGRAVGMPLARRGCRSVLECVLFKGNGSARDRSDFDPLPLRPSESLRGGLDESRQVWENIQRDAAARKGVGSKDDGGHSSDSLDGGGNVRSDVVDAARHGRSSVEQSDASAREDAAITREEATKLASAFSETLSKCQDQKAQLASCDSEEECQRAFLGVTVCAGQFMCPLQHSSLIDSLSASGGADEKSQEIAEAKISTAMDVLGECVANYDARAGEARRKFPEVFEGVLKKGKQ